MLPNTKTKPLKDFADKEIVFYGDEKIGKTTFLAGLPDCLIVDTEHGTTSIEAYVVQIENWVGFLDLLNKLENEKHQFNNIALDTIDELKEYCYDYIKARHKVTEISDIPHGRGYVEFGTEFRRQMKRLKKLKDGIWYCSHSTIIEDEEHKIRMIVPACYDDKRVKRIIHPSADIILYATFDLDGKRIIYTKPTRQYIAGDRTGVLPDKLPLNPEALIKAYYESSGDDGEGKLGLIAMITKGELYLAEKKWDNFDTPARVKNSRKKHLETETLEEATFSNLQAYLTHLKKKAIEGKEKKNGTSSKSVKS